MLNSIIHLSDDQLPAVPRLAGPLRPDARDTFFQLLANQLCGCADIGDGELHRPACRIIHDNNLFDPPLECEADDGQRSRGRMYRSKYA